MEVSIIIIIGWACLWFAISKFSKVEIKSFFFKLSIGLILLINLISSFRLFDFSLALNFELSNLKLVSFIVIFKILLLERLKKPLSNEVAFFLILVSPMIASLDFSKSNVLLSCSCVALHLGLKN